MKFSKPLSIALLVFLLFSATAKTAQAHPADLYAHTIHITVTRAGLQIQWEIKPGPLLTAFLWNEMDADQDGTLNPLEIQTWGNARAALLTAALDDKPLPLRIESVHLPNDLRSFQAGEEFITFVLAADWPPSANNVRRLIFENRMEPQNSINWFYLTALDDTAFLFPSQQSHLLSVEIIQDHHLLADSSNLLLAWDSGTPSLPFGQEKDLVTETAEQVAPALAERSSQDILLDLVRSGELSFVFYVIALLIALALGALHALTPGHGKTVVAAYLVGSRGTAWHAVALGTVVTLTHTGSVFMLGIVTLAASQYILPTTIIPFLEILSGLLILSLGFYLLWLRYAYWRKQTAAARSSATTRKISLSPTSAARRISGEVKIQRPSAGMHHHGDGRMHSHEIPQSVTWRSLIALGISGGMVPCPDAIAILLVAIAINRLALGLALIVSFSLGLAVVLIIVGLLMVTSRRLFDRIGFLDRVAPALPIVSAVIVILLGFGLTWGAYVRAKGNVHFVAPVQMSVDEARILYLAEDEDKVKRLFITDAAKKTPRAVTQPFHDVIEYALSPDQTRIVYVVLTDTLENQIWLGDVEGGKHGLLSECADAICSGLVWSPDGRRILYERLSLSGNAAGFSSLWWIEANNGKEAPVFQEASLPGGKPRWSPNGEWLSYSAPQGVRLVHLESGETRTLENALGAAALWSPDSRSVLLRDVVIQRNQFVTQLFLYNLESGTTVNLNPSEGFENLIAAWSPGGEFIAVVRRDLSVPRGDQIWLMRADGGNVRAITVAPDALHGSLQWSPDGRYLLYDLYRLDAFPSVSELQIVEIATGEVQELDIRGYSPSWVWR